MYKHTFRLVHDGGFTDLAYFSSSMDVDSVRRVVANVEGCPLWAVTWLRSSLVCGEVVGVN